MLVLSRKAAEQVEIGDDVVLTVLSLKGGRVKLGISAPTETRVRRGELVDRDDPREAELIAASAPKRLPR